MRNRPESTGVFLPDERRGVGRGAGPGRPAPAAWMTDELIEETREVWSKAYGREVPVDEAVEMLAGLRQLSGLLLGTMREEEAA